MINDTAILRAYAAAVSVLLLGNRRLKPSAGLLAGDRLDPLARLSIGQMACDAQTDLVHLGFEEQAGVTEMTDISIFVPRDQICWSHLGCRLWLSKSGTRALLLPQPHVRGSFRLAPSEILHLGFKPLDIEDGVARADARLRDLVERGVDPGDRVAIHDWPIWQ
ncbi:MAG: hypothetical protein DI530_04775 [Sphingomonas sp.]|uniref:Uncharacterized protein n=1 Tax=Sphingomonas adhaesiva TaxID=28212 RepID=A0A2A4I6N9_9SPHN|nr:MULTISPECIES: hypothetical protein [Sphingomonas]PCG14261.1 hypothetical protein COA07_10760 [Sphingomonas adhaesiva]PZU80599.1 MAG: hypothetical protein DI530_04775 [Sphingomonas sp.]